ncbi:DUF924 family protein [Leptospira biflexa]|uniref:DUF924 family protein n=1 Tax=Leptospira biflexa TaxID=172 RepID=UPI0014383986|nr:DUF924 family protein [Leptospira biflexa]
MNIINEDIQKNIKSILDYWFGDLNDSTILNREIEPFSTYFNRWYGKKPEIDIEIKEKFEPILINVTSKGDNWEVTLHEWASYPYGLIALTILLDQFPRNMYREKVEMYKHDALGLLVSEFARSKGVENLPIVHQMFLSVPLMHVENLTLQEQMYSHFKRFVEIAKQRSPHNLPFWNFAVDYAKLHVEVIREFGRFPHRNAILERLTTREEILYLKENKVFF